MKKDNNKTQKKNKLKEQLAELCHDQWSGWMDYMFDKCSFDADGDALIPHELVDRWGRQLRTPYEELSQEEQDSDRNEADRFIHIFRKHLNFKDLMVDEVDELLS